ncbi:UDP-N-acetylmuramoyl-L-alanyl-D-glutamate--2,6-diaminopimelate ligase [Fundicoccus culcitae]|uniref:UDP-N-acetylmuramoyl-L-alanyl-D-glutamate--2,6-diaminopimelate ligase n=1 Tax=Fundicoccus culcitae TaxID=2969821 RepID=A0ABY5P6H1_9LACT|nr:UDP-N-acetylmuramoyl-L-alanyl-D-glutamate--2,6-diaminopimelate ligase [Fundicoccus culcitae]UUX34003.1 UDP-N-acetylmuramoyl-L-alanyl-D-glutamate--2,6-diaminopimelate ligase [Fundicoccus culcitae]
MLATQLIKVLGDYQLFGQPLDELANIDTLINDSRQAQTNSCFIAIKGENFDGHQAIEAVVAQGTQLLIVEKWEDAWLKLEASFILVPSTYRAQAILANQFYGEPTTKMNVVAVTGTNGKTTTSSIISDLLNVLGHKTGLIGTIHYKVDQTYYPAVNTTPNALRLQELFSEMVEVGVKDAIIEASSHALALGRLWYTDVDCAIFTNITREHLDFHKTMEAYTYAKSLLFAQLGQKFNDGKPRLAILNADDDHSPIMAQATGANIVTYSLSDSKATAYMTEFHSGVGTIDFKFVYHQTEYAVQLPMLGEYNISNYLAAFLCLVTFYQFEPEAVVNATTSFKGVSGRMQAINRGQNFTAIVDFAHTPDAIEHVLKELTRKKKQRLIVLFGHSGGNRDSQARPEIGDILFEYADYIVFTADNPRFEPVAKICRELIQNHTEKPYTIIEDRKEAIQHAVQEAKVDDIILFAGKGGESYQVIGNENVPYNEAETVTATIDDLLNKD